MGIEALPGRDAARWVAVPEAGLWGCRKVRKNLDGTRSGVGERPVYGGGPVVDPPVEQDRAGGVDGAGAVGRLAYVEADVGRRSLLLPLAHGVSCPQVG